MFKNRQKQEESTGGTNANFTGESNFDKEKKAEEFNQQYLNRHTKYKDDTIMNPEVDPEEVVTGDVGTLVSSKFLDTFFDEFRIFSILERKRTNGRRAENARKLPSRMLREGSRRSRTNSKKFWVGTDQRVGQVIGLKRRNLGLSPSSLFKLK